MKEIIIFIIGLVVGVLAVLAVRRNETDLVGLNKERAQQKERNKQKVLALLEERDEISNDDVEEFLGVSDATAERYLNELEQEGKLEQLGKTGQSVRYRKR